ncbi:hypothetical protein EON65_52085 [archaeon]|nr:MAG: hypothetical protein EON65_52085 [archaeon]
MNIKVEKPLPHPTIVSFPQGLPINADELEVVAGKKGKDRNEKIQVIVQHPDHTRSKVVYKGGNFGESAKNKNCYKYAVGVVDSSDPGKWHKYNLYYAQITQV